MSIHRIDDRYRILYKIGQGGMGQVFRAEHTFTRRPVALKVIHPQFQHNRAFRERFLREIELACRVQHPHAVQILDAGELDSGTLYMAMEYLNGQTLSRVLKTFPEGFDVDAALHITRQIGRALDAIHTVGLVHRDLKPDNIMIMRRPGEPLSRCIAKILDFGIARDVDTLYSITGNILLGTPAFMSPEQTRGERLSQTSDIYNLGLLLYTMLTGRGPFSSDTPIGYVFHHNTTPPPPVSSMRAGITPNIERAIQKALSKDPGLRFATASAFIASLEPAGAGACPLSEPAEDREPVPAAGQPTESKRPARLWKNTLAFTLGGAICLVLMAFFGHGPVDLRRAIPAIEPVMDQPVLAADLALEERLSAPHLPRLSTGAIHAAQLGIGPDSQAVETSREMRQPPVPKQSARKPLRNTNTVQRRTVDRSRSTGASSRSGRPTWGAQPSAGRPRAAQQPVSEFRRPAPEKESGVDPAPTVETRHSVSDTAPKIAEPDPPAPAGRQDERGIYLVPDEMPDVAGGFNALHARIRYPAKAIDANVSGTVSVRLLIDRTGRVRESAVVKSVGFGCDEEVLRVVRGARFVPARVDGRAVDAWLTLSFRFQMDA